MTEKWIPENYDEEVGEKLVRILNRHIQDDVDFGRSESLQLHDPETGNKVGLVVIRDEEDDLALIDYKIRTGGAI